MRPIYRSGSLVTLVAMFLMVGCAPTLGPVFQTTAKAPGGAAVVYIYRPSHFGGSGVSYDVRANGVVVVTLYNGGYYPYFAQPGEVELSAKTEASSSVTLDIKAGQTYYVRGTVGVGFFVGHPRLEIVPAEVGEKEIVETKLLPEPKSQ